MHTTDLEARVAALEDLSDVMDKLRTATMKNENRRAAENAALRIVVKELAIHAGVTSKDFEGHIKVRKEFYLDHVLGHIEDKISPRRSAELDDRTLDEVPVDYSIPPLFP